MQHSRSSKSEILYRSTETTVGETFLTEPPQAPAQGRSNLEQTEGSSKNDSVKNLPAPPFDDLNGMSEHDAVLVLDCAASSGYRNLGVDEDERCGEEAMEATEEIVNNNDDASFVDLAYMNINTNGKSMGDGILEMMEPTAILESKACLRKVKHINMGEMPLKPVGLSLSGSGMQLYVKVDSEEKKRLLANATVKCTTKVRKTRTKKEMKAKTSVLSTTTQTANLPTPLTRTPTSQSNHPTLGDMKRPATPVKRDFSSAEEKAMQTWQDHGHCQSNSFACDKPYHRNVDTPRPQRPTAVTNSKTSAAQKAQKRLRTRSPEEMILSSMKFPVPAQLVRARGTDRGARPLFSGPSWKFKNGKIDVSNTVITGKRSPDEVGEEKEDVICLDDDHRTCHPVFTSNDLPLKPLDQAHVEPSKKCNARRQGRARHDEQPIGQKYPPEYVDSPVSSSPSRRDASSDEDDISDRQLDDRGAQDKHKKTRPVSRGKKSFCDAAPSRHRALENVRVKSEDCEPPSLSRMFDKATSSTSIVDNKSLSPTAVDEVTLAKFTEYTNNMRKDLKQNFKNLSQLIKDFNQEVLERNNNRSSQSSSTVGDMTKHSNSSTSRSSCCVM